MKNVTRAVLCTMVLTLGGTAVPAVSNATAIGKEGCTPGYWKNHTDKWEEATPSTIFGAEFTAATSSVAGLTMGETLAGGGGTGVDGAARILARAATAAWLNAAHEGLGYPWRRTEVSEVDGRMPLETFVNSAFASGDRATMLAAASRLDKDNNLGCPLN